MNKEILIEAGTFFDNESQEFKQEMEVEALLVDIACEFIKYRDRNNLTQKDLARILHVTQAMVSKLESGDYNPSIRMLYEIAQKLSWNFKIEFNEVVKKVSFKCDMKELAVSDNNANMGLAS